jgi:hypothetical protein
MTKPKQTAPVETVEHEQLPAVIIPTGEDYINQAVNDLQAVDGQELIDQQIEALKGQYLGLSVSDLNDRPAYVALVDGAKLAKKLRLAVENKRKELNEFPLKFQRAVNAEAKRITEALSPVEQHCLAEVAKFEQAEEQAKKAEQARKHKELIEAGWVYNGNFYVCGPISMTLDQVMRMNEDQWKKAIKHGEDEKARIVAEKARVEAEQKRQAEEADRLRIEQENLRKEQEQLRKDRLEIRGVKLANIGVMLEGDMFTRNGQQYFSADDCATMSNDEFIAWIKEIGPNTAKPTAPVVETAPEPIAIDIEVDPFGHAAIEAAAQRIEDTLNTDLADALAPSHSAEYLDGYEQCREQVLAIFNDGVQRRRSEFIEAITNLKP